MKGHLFALNDSSIQVLLGKGKNVDTTVFIQHVKNVSLRRKHAPGRGFFGGMGVGAVAGAIIGYASYTSTDRDDTSIGFERGVSAVGGGILGMWTGGIIGLVTHIGYKNFALDGEMMKYDLLKEKILSGPTSTLERKPKVVSDH